MPKFSLLILTHNRLDDVKRCFTSLMPTALRSDVDLWVLDNGSTDGVVSYLETLQGEMSINRVMASVNYGVAGGRARLLAKATGDIIVFLDSDTEIIDPNWLDALAVALEQESVGLVGPGGSMVLPDWSGFIAGRPGEVDCVSGACQAFKRELLDYGLHMEADRYPGFWAEDSSFCLQVRALGFDVLCVPIGVAHHPAHSGLGQDMTLHDKHIALFREQWQGKGLVKAEGGY